MDLWQLRIFCKLVEHQSFSKAGRIVHLSQPTISSHIKDLEAHFGCRLVDRLGRKTTPTKAGQILYRYARQLLVLRDEAEAAMADFQGSLKGRLEIGGSTIPGGYILPQIIGGFKECYPEVMISLIVGDTRRMIEDTLTGDLELAVVGARVQNKTLFQEELFEDEMRVIVPAGHPWAKRRRIKMEMLLSEPFIVREPGSGTLKSIQAQLAEKGYSLDDLNVVAEMGSTEAVIGGILNHVGVSILSTIAVAEALRWETLAALTVEGIGLKRSFFLTYHRHRSHSPISSTFIEYLKSHGAAKKDTGCR